MQCAADKYVNHFSRLNDVMITCSCFFIFCYTHCIFNPPMQLASTEVKPRRLPFSANTLSAFRSRPQHGTPTVKGIRVDVTIIIQPIAASSVVVHTSNPTAHFTMLPPTRTLAHSATVPREAAMAAHAHSRIDKATTVTSISELLVSLGAEPGRNGAEAPTRRTKQP